MVPPVFRSPTEYVFVAVYAVWVVPEVVDSIRSSGGDGPDLDAHSKYAIYAAIGVTVAGGFAFAAVLPAWAGFGPLAVPLFWLGCLLALAGVGLRWYSVSVLGSAFDRSVTVSDDQPVVEEGPYGRVRHPTYTGSLATLAGIGLAFGTWPGLVVALVAGSLGYGYRIRVEERALRAELDGYDEYCERVPYRLVPGLY